MTARFGNGGVCDPSNGDRSVTAADRAAIRQPLIDRIMGSGSEPSALAMREVGKRVSREVEEPA